MTKAPGKHPFNLLAYRHAVVPTIHTTYDKHHHQPPVMLVTLWPVRERTVLARPSFASRLSLSLSLSPRSLPAMLLSPSISLLAVQLHFLRRKLPTAAIFLPQRERNGLDFGAPTATSFQIIAGIPRNLLSVVWFLKLARERVLPLCTIDVTTGRSIACTHTSRCAPPL